VNVFGQLPVEDVTHHVVECRSLQHARQQYPQLFQPDMLSAPDAFTLSRYVFNHKDQRVLAQALHELYEERKAMLANQPPQQQQQQQPPPPPQPPQQVLQCPRMTDYVGCGQEQQRRRETGACH
jgi:hypothetical protein